MAVYQINITQTAGNTAVTEGGATDTYTLVLESAPTADVVITLGNTNGQVNVDFATLTFTTDNWNTAQTVTVSAVNDTVGEGMHRGVIQHTVTSADGNYNGLVVGNVIVAVTDNDLPVGDPAFNSPITNPLGLTDIGSNAAPSFVDIDGDGDLDAFIDNNAGDTWFFQNTGTASLAAFAAPVSNAFGLTDAGSFAKPTFVDINDDGLLDAFIGNYDGNSLFYQNTGTASLAAFAAPVSNAFGLTNVGSYASPTFVDIDSDGDLDAFIGNRAGETLFYQNIGTASLAAFASPVSNAFSLTNGDTYTVPTFVDINGDGLLDAFISNQAGNTLFYRNTGTVSLAVFTTPVSNAFGLTNVGNSASPTFVDINGDGKLDAFIGNNLGITRLFLNSPAPTNVVPTLTTLASTLTTGNEDTAITITFANLAAQGNEADDGTVTAFAVKAISSGSLKIGTSALTATDFNAATNYLVNATKIAYWTPDANANGTQNAFTVTAIDDMGAESITAIQATVDVTAVADIIITQTAGNTAVIEGGATDTYTLVLESAPTADVVITLGNTNGQVNVDFATLTFTTDNWNVAQTVTVSAVNDTMGEFTNTGVINYTVASTDANYNNIAIANTIVTVTDNDLPVGNPTFQPAITNPFGLGDVGQIAHPTLVDIDGDGDLDAFVGYNDGNTLFYENTGTASFAVFATPISNAFGLTYAGISTSPTFIDIDGDGDPDAFIGNLSGDILFYENTGTASLAAFATATTNPFGLGDVGSYAVPTLVDIDGDGDLDAFVGNNAGNTWFYQNTGTASSAAFANPSTSPFGLGDVGNSANPTFVDIDGDGDLDAFVGNQAGDTLFYLNTGTASSAAFATPSTSPFGLGDVGPSASPTFIDIDGDGDLDAFVGNNAGNTLFYINNAAPISTNDTVTTLEDTAVVLTTSDFGTYSDSSVGSTATAFAAVQITTLASAGTLEYNNGSNWAAVTLDQEISVTDITAGNLRFTPTANGNGDGYATVGFKVSDGTTFSATANTLTVDVTSVNDAPTLTAFVSTLVTGDEDTAVTVTLANLVDQSDEADDGTVTAFSVKAITSGTLKIGTSALTATDFNAATNYLVNATNIAYWTPAANANGTQNAFTVTAVDNTGAESATAIQATVSVTAVNDIPTLTAFIAALATGNEDTAITITLANLADQSDAIDVDLNGAAFAVKAITSGTLKIGADAATALAFNAATNYLVDATHFAYWTPDANANGIQNAFTVTAIDDMGAESITAIQATVDVTAVADIIITQTAGNTAVTEGFATDTYTVVLDTAPTADVIITLGNTNGQVSTDFTTLTFTTLNWNVAQTVTVSAVDDTVGEGMHRGVIQHTVTSANGNYHGLVVGNVIVAVTDNDLPVGNPVFTSPTSNPLGLTDVGLYAKPNLVDIDGDGDLDAFIGNSDGNTLFYQNTGTASSASFSAPVSNAFGLTDVGFYAAPTFVDIDGDSDLDAFIGNTDGNALFYENTGTASLAAFTTPTSNAFGLTDVGNMAAPSLVDIDGDGDLDAFIGNFDGNTLFYQNTGTASLAAFTTPVSNAFGLTDVGMNASPSLVDIDGDGLLDAFIGNRDGIAGNTLFYENTGSASSAAFTAPVSNAFNLTAVFGLSSPSFVDIDGDGDLDAFIGNQVGNTLLFINNAAPTLTAFTAALATGNEDSAITITFLDLAAQGDEADSDGTITAFAVKAITSGSLKIGTSMATAADWDAASNYLVDATNIAYWTPAANGTQNAFTVTAVDNTGAESATAIQATVEVTAAPGIIITQTAGNTAVTEGGVPDGYDLVLSRAPLHDVVITLGTTNGQVSTNGLITLTFTADNWSAPQGVLISAVNDTVGEGMHRGVIQHTVTSDDDNYHGMVVGNVIVAVTDNDLPVGNPVFTSPTSNPLGLTDIGSNAAPSFVDIDGDGDLDAFIGKGDGNALYYENTGTASLAAFTTPVSNAFGLTDVGGYATPSFVDIDGDGDLDAFIGNSAGNTLFYENTGTASLAVFAAPISNAFGLTNVGNYAAPSFVDIDGDGDLDAFIGKGDGNALFYENTGTASLAVFATPVSNAFGLTNVGSFARPTFVDIDSDGDQDAFIANYAGNTLFYQNIGTASSASFDSPVTNSSGVINLAYRAALSLVDIDGDGDLDAFIGNESGNTQLFINTLVSANAAPILASATAMTNINDTATATPFSAFTITDADSASLTVSIALDTAAKGVFTAASLSSSGFSTTDNGLTYSHAPGTPAALQAALQLLVFEPTANRVAALAHESTHFTVSVSDGVAPTVTNTTTTVTVWHPQDPTFMTPVSNPLGLTDIGSYAWPTFVDINDDGDLDAFISNKVGETWFYENTGTASLAVFTAPVTNAFGLTYIGDFASPGFVDIDGDGDLDAFIGERYGNTLFYENTGTASLAVFAAPISNSFGLTNVGTYAAPSLVDIDGDGDLDAFIGNLVGDTLFYQNTGTASLAAFTTPVTNAFGLTNAAFAKPRFVDIDGDGDLDAFIGNWLGNTLFYENTGTASLAAFAAPVSNAFGLTDVGYAAAPTFVDINGDGKLDAFIGNSDGKTNLFINNAAPTNAAPTLAGATAVTNINDTGTTTPFSAFTITDADSASLTVSIALDTAAKGVFTAASLSSSGFSTTYNGLTYSHATGTPAALQAALQLLVFEPTANRVAALGHEITHFTVSVSDGVAPTVTDTTTTVTVWHPQDPNFTTPVSNPLGLTQVSGKATPSLVDIDGDGDLDAFIGESNGNTLFYENTGTASLAAFAAPVYNAFGLTNVGGWATPSFVDIDHDGDLDAFIGNSAGETRFYQNTGTASLAVFTAPIINAFGLTSVGGYTAATLVDIDGDGDLDAFIGNLNGNTLFYQNTGTASSASFTAPVSNDFGLTNVGNFAKPSLVDIDGDGDLDAFIGDMTGNSLFYENTGTATLAVFATPVSNAFGLISVGVYMAPTFVDINDDGKLDAFIGNSDGQTNLFINNAAPTLVTFTSALATGNEDTAITITFANLTAQGDETDDGTVTAFAVKEITSGTLKIGADAWDAVTNYLVDEAHIAYWTPDANANGTLNAFTVTAVDNLNAQSATAIQATVNVINLNDAQVFTSGPSGSIDENALISAVIYTATTTDADIFSVVTYSLGGADLALLAIDEVSGVVTLLASADFESKASYNFDVIANDGITTTTQAVVVSVNDLNDAPVFTSGATDSVDENALISAVIYTATTTDADIFSVVTYSLGGADLALLAIDEVSGVVTLLASADFESKASYNFDVIANDGITTTTQAVVVSVNDLNDAPVFTSGATDSVDENALITTVIYTAVTTDADNLASRTYTLGGDDAGLLDITAGVVTLKASANFEAKASYSFNIIAFDGTLTTPQAVVVSVNNLNDNAPVFTSGAIGSVDENALSSTVIYTAVTTDADNLTSRTYTLGGDDQALLDINAETGAVTLKASANFEAKASYSFNVIAFDGTETTPQAVVVSVNNLNDNTPVFTSGETGSVEENALIDTVIYTATTTDADDLSMVTFSLGGDDLALLDINVETGAVTLKEAADFESKASYNFNVIASDGTLTTPQTVVVSVLNLNDNAPTGLVTITGTATQNQTLIAANTLADADGLGVIAYQWFANGTAINGATAESFTLGQEQVAQAITVQASYIDGADALEQVTSDASANVIALQADTAGNDSFVGSVDNSTVGYDFALADMSTNITRVGLSSDGKTVVFKGIDGTDTLTNIEDLVFGSDTISMADFLKMVTVTQLFDSLGNTNKTYAMPDLYTGPLDLDYQLIDESDNAVIIGSDSNDFIKVAGSGNKAVNSGTGNDVIDGSTGSSFLTSGEGNDTVFLDGRMAGTSWSTLTDFQQGQDHATIFGWVNGVSKVVGFSNSDGAAGYTGLTLHIQNLLPDGSAVGTTNPALNSLTLTGHTLAEFGASSLADLNSQIASGTNTHFLTGQVTDSFGTHGYLYIS